MTYIYANYGLIVNPKIRKKINKTLGASNIPTLGRQPKRAAASGHLGPVGGYIYMIAASVALTKWPKAQVYRHLDHSNV